MKQDITTRLILEEIINAMKDFNNYKPTKEKLEEVRKSIESHKDQYFDCCKSRIIKLN